MSLDVCLNVNTPITQSKTGIFVRRNGKTEELSYNEAKLLYPDANIEVFEEETNTVFRANITHNLNTMAEHVGVYSHLWEPDKIGIIKANELIQPLRDGIHEMKLNPDKYKRYNPENGWGNYDGLLNFMESYLNACYEYPNSIIEVCR